MSTRSGISDREILTARPARNRVDPRRPYAFHVEPECSATGEVVDVATIFLTNRECAFRCLMCDLWKNTTEQTVAPGDIPHQIDVALSQLPPARQIKLYNSGNFFDHRAIIPEDYPDIAERVRSFERLIVENHPRLCTDECPRFRDLLNTELEVALGLETVHPQVLEKLNKQMTLDDFARAAEFLKSHGIAVRAFILLRPPFLDEAEGVEWATRSIKSAFAMGVECCSVIPTRSGNGIIDRLETEGQFAPPTLTSMETVLEAGLRFGHGRVLVDLWDAERFADCPHCAPLRIKRLNQINLTQRVPDPVVCGCRNTVAEPEGRGDNSEFGMGNSEWRKT